MMKKGSAWFWPVISILVIFNSFTGCATQPIQLSPTTGLPAIASPQVSPTIFPTQFNTPQPTPTKVVSSGKIAFSSERNGNFDIYVMDPDGSCLALLADDDADELAPVWSPDGSQLAYLRQPISNNQEISIYVMDAGGSNRIKLTADNTRIEVEPRWSPDGKQIVYASYFEGFPDLYKASVEIHEVTALDSRPEYQLISSMSTESSTRNWSPDGKTIVYMGVEDKGFQLLTIPAEGGKYQLLTDEAYNHFDPTWSPDGSKILYLRVDLQSDSVKGDLYIINPAGSDNHALYSGRGTDYSPVWSPDGKKIAFVSERDGNPELYVINADGQNLLRLTNNQAKDGSPGWSPDGQQLVFTSDRDGNDDIYTINLADLRITRLTDSPADDTSPVWSPAGVNYLDIPCQAQASPTPEPTYQPVSPPILSADAITIANADHLSELGRIGSGSVQSITWSPNGRQVAVGTTISLILYEFPSLKQIWKIASTSTIYDAKFSPDGQSIASGAENGDINLWQVIDGKLVRSFLGHTGCVNKIAFSPDGVKLASTSCDKSLRFWNVATGSLVSTFVDNVAHTELAFSPDGKILASVAGSAITLWDVQSMKLIRDWAVDDDFITSVDFLSDGNILAGGTLKNGVGFWNAKDGTPIKSILAGKICQGIKFSPDEKKISCLSQSSHGTGFIGLWSVEDGKPLFEIEGDIVSVVNGGFSPDGMTLVVGSNEEGILRFWSTQNWALLNSIEFSSNPLSLVITPGSDRFAVGWSDSKTRFWKIPMKGNSIDDQPVDILDSHDGNIAHLAMSPDGRFLVTASESSFPALVWDLKESKIVKEIKDGMSGFNAVAFSPDGKILALKSDEGQLWNVPDWKLKRALREVSFVEQNLVYSPDGKVIATATSPMDNQIKLVQSGDGSLIRVINFFDADNEGTFLNSTSLAFSPDGKMIAAGSSGSVLKLWRVSDGNLLLEIDNPMAKSGMYWKGITSLAFSPGSDLIAATYEDKTIRLWSVVDGKLVKALQADAIVLAFSPDGRLLISANYDGTVRLWAIKP